MARTFINAKVVAFFPSDQYPEIRVCSLDRRESLKYRCIDLSPDKEKFALFDQLKGLVGQDVMIQFIDVELQKKDRSGSFTKFFLTGIQKVSDK